MKKRALVNRWKDEEGSFRQKKIIEVLSKGEPLSSLPWLDKHYGRWDLRGVKFSSVASEKTVKRGGNFFVKRTGCF